MHQTRFYCVMLKRSNIIDTPFKSKCLVWNPVSPLLKFGSYFFAHDNF